MKESERRYQELADQLPQTVVEFDERGIFTFANTKGLEEFGYTREDLARGVNVLETVAPEDRDRARENIEKHLRGEEVVGHEYIMIRKNGTRFPAVIHTAPIVLDSKVLGMRSIVVDITDLKRAEEVNARLAAIVESSDDAIIGKDLTGTIVTWNKGAERIYGYTAEEVISKSISVLAAPDCLDEIPGFLDQVRSGKSIRNHETVRLRKDGSRTNVSLTISPIKDGLGKIVGASTIARDITGRKQAGERLRDSETRYRNLYESMMDCLAQTSVSGEIVLVNSSYLAMLGYSEEEVLKLSYQDLTPERWHPFEQEIIQTQVLQRGYSDVFEKEYIRKDGTVFPVELRVFLLRDTAGRPTGMWGIVRDITDRKKAEEAIKKREEELEAKSSELEEANIALKVMLRHREEDRITLQKTILANVKELVFPYIEKLKNGCLNESQVVYLSIIESSLNDVLSPFLQRIAFSYAAFTPMEIQIANLTRAGKASKEIAASLGLSKRTVDTHKNNIRKKLGLSNKKVNLHAYLISLENT